MGLAQISKQLGKSVEQELTLIFASMGDSRLPEAAHRCPVRQQAPPGSPLDEYVPVAGNTPLKGMDASGLNPHAVKTIRH